MAVRLVRRPAETPRRASHRYFANAAEAALRLVKMPPPFAVRGPDGAPVTAPSPVPSMVTECTKSSGAELAAVSRGAAAGAEAGSTIAPRLGGFWKRVAAEQMPGELAGRRFDGVRRWDRSAPTVSSEQRRRAAPT